MPPPNPPSDPAHEKTAENDAPANGIGRRARRGVWRAGWALADHVLFAGANFLVQLGLARQWLSEHDFGVFSAAYVSFLVLGVFQTALLTEPVALFGAKLERADLPAYLGRVVGIHLMISLVGGVLLAAIGTSQLMFGERTLGVALCALAVAQVFQLLPWTLRVACYLGSDPMHAGLSGLLYLMLVVGMLLGLDAMGWMSIPTAVGAMALSSLAVCIYLVLALRVSLHTILQPSGYRAVLRDHWRYGKWAIPTGLMRWVPEHLPVLAAPLVIGWAANAEPDFEAGGALKAILHLSVPLVLFIFALSTLLVPMLVRRRGTPAFARLSWQIFFVTFAVTLVCWPALGLNHERVVRLLYGGSFMQHTPLLWLVGLIPVVLSINCILHAQLHAVERPDRAFYGSIGASAVLVFVGLPLLAVWGLTGILIAMLIAYTAQALVLWRAGRSIIRAACYAENSLASSDPACTLKQPDQPHQEPAETDLPTGAR